MPESDLYPAILTALSHGDTRLFRTQAGQFWQGRVTSQSATHVTLAHPRVVRVGVPGMSDITGIHAGRFVAIEAKYGRGRLSVEQRAYLGMVRDLGGIAGVARSVADAEAILAGALILA
jgi:hypothetical protein